MSMRIGVLALLDKGKFKVFKNKIFRKIFELIRDNKSGNVEHIGINDYYDQPKIYN